MQSEGKRPLRSSRYRGWDNIKKEKGARGRDSEDVLSIHLAQDSVQFEAINTAGMNTLMNLCFHKTQDIL